MNPLPSFRLQDQIPERYRSGRNGVDSKSTCPLTGARGFESHPLRQLTPSQGFFVV
jgi:hypothetical protein